MASSRQEAFDAIAGLIKPAWDTATGGAPLFFPNYDEDPPDRSIWGRLSLRHSVGGRANIGPSARFRRTGTIFVQIFLPKDTGEELGNSVGETIQRVLEDAGSIGNVWFRNVSLREVGADTGQTSHQFNVEAEFTYDRVT